MYRFSPASFSFLVSFFELGKFGRSLQITWIDPSGLLARQENHLWNVKKEDLAIGMPLVVTRSY